MTRTGFRSVAAVAAIAVLAALLWLLSSPGRTPAPDDAPEESRSTAPRESGEAAEAREAAAGGARAAERPAPGSPESGDEPAAGPEEKKEPTIPGLCVLEDGTPLAGVQVHISRGDPLPDQRILEAIGTWTSHRSQADGSFELHAGRRLSAQHPWAGVVAVEGGVLETEAKITLVRTDAAAASVKVIFRDNPGTAHVRLVDSSTQQPITDLRGFRLSYLLGGDQSGRAVYDFPKDTGLGGWIPIREGALPEDLAVEADPGTVVVEFAVSGFAPARVGLLQIRGRMMVGVDPIPPCVTGLIALPKGPYAPPEMAHQPVSASIRPQDGQPPADLAGVRGLPTAIGLFRLDDLPQGAYVLEITDTRYATIRRAKRAFEYRGSPVDLGTIEFSVGARINARAIDSEGKPIPQARLVIVREGEDPEKARVLPKDQDGRVGLSDLEPGVDHRVVALGLPRVLEKPARTTADGKPVEVELQWPERLVPCRISLVVDGKAVQNPDGSRTIPATVHESPLPREEGAWNPDGTFEARLVPGTYRFSVYATPEGGGDLVLFAGEVTVPAGDSFETRVELAREGR